MADLQSQPTETNRVYFLPSLRIFQPLKHRSYALIWFGQTVSTLGNFAYFTVLTWTVYAISGSTAATGYVLTASAIPQLILLMFGGIVGDRFSRRMVLLTSDTLSCLSVAAVALLAAFGHLTVLELATLSVVFGIVSAFFLPAYRAILAELVPSDQLQSANALTGLSMNVTLVLGPAIGASLYAWGRAAAAFGFDAISFLVAAASSLLVRLPPRPFRLQQSMWRDLGEGWNYIRRTTWLWLTIALATVCNAVGGAPFIVLLPAILRDLHLDVGFMGLTFVIFGIASVVVNLVLASLPKLRHRGIVMYGLWSLAYASTVVTGLAPSYSLIVVAAILLGIGVGGETLWSVLVQELIPQEYLSRVFSLDLLGSYALRPVGLAAAGIIAAATGPRAVLIGGGLIGLIALLVGLLSPSVRQLD